MRIFSFFLLIFIYLQAFPQPVFNDYFTKGTLRIDYLHAGNAEEEYFFVDELIAEPFWGGSQTNLIDNMNYGKHLFKIFDKTTKTLIYSRGYNTLFCEWQITEEAQKIQKSFSETLVMPFPKNEIIVVLFSRDYETGDYVEKYRFDVNPNNYFIKHDNRMKYPAISIENNGMTSEKVDIVILPEGYQAKELELFINDCKKFTEELFSFEPYASHRKRFNIHAVLAPSEDSGADIPKDSTWKNTLLDCSYYTFDSERYLMTSNNKSVRDLAANAPYDQIYILINSPKYGGGGIFNHYCISVNNNPKSDKIHIHEFGHGFANLADEYTDNDTYVSMYNLSLEPKEANITTLVDFESKWVTMIDKKTPIPTPPSSTYKNKIGAFEGAGYVSKGMYRPMQDCLMNTFKNDIFCPVCQKAIVKMIDFYATKNQKNN